MVTGDIEKAFFFIAMFNDFVEHGCLSTTQPAPRLTICFVLMCNNYRTDGSGVMNSSESALTPRTVFNIIIIFGEEEKNLICSNTLHKTILAFIRVEPKTDL